MSSTIDDREDPARIERNSEQIRADMSATLDALGRKLSPGQLIDRSAAFLRDNGGELAANFGRQIKENPVPLAITAVGLVWLMAASNRSSRPRQSAYYGTDDYAPDDYATAYATGDLSGATQSESGSKLSHAKERVQQTASHLKERVSQTAHAARERLRSTGERLHSSGEGLRSGREAATQRVGSVARSTREQALRARDSFATMAEEQPLALGAIGLAIGAIIGAALPGTRREDELLGRARDRALDRAREVGSEQYARLRERAVDAAERAQQAAKEAFTETDAQGERSVATAPRDEGAFRGASTPAGRA